MPQQASDILQVFELHGRQSQEHALIFPSLVTEMRSKSDSTIGYKLTTTFEEKVMPLKCMD